MGRDTIIELYFESDEYIRHLESSMSNKISNEERQQLKNRILDVSWSKVHKTTLTSGSVVANTASEGKRQPSHPSNV